jgi:hypothetical protein
MGWAIGVLGLESRLGMGNFLFPTASRTALGPIQPPIQWVLGALSLGVKRSGREADHSLPYRGEVKEYVELCLHSSNTPSWHDAQLKHRDNFTLSGCFQADDREWWRNSLWREAIVSYLKVLSQRLPGGPRKTMRYLMIAGLGTEIQTTDLQNTMQTT